MKVVTNKIFLIQKNTQDLRQKLEDMGFKKNPYMSHEEYVDEESYLALCYTEYDNEDTNISFITAKSNSVMATSRDTINCGDDEDLFIKYIESIKEKLEDH